MRTKNNSRYYLWLFILLGISIIISFLEIFQLGHMFKLKSLFIIAMDASLVSCLLLMIYFNSKLLPLSFILMVNIRYLYIIVRYVMFIFTYWGVWDNPKYSIVYAIEAKGFVHLSIIGIVINLVPYIIYTILIIILYFGSDKPDNNSIINKIRA